MGPSEILALAKEVVAVAKKFNDLEFQKKIVDLQAEIVGLTSELTDRNVVIAQKDARISELEEMLRFKAKLVKDGKAYYETDENGQPIGDPYCTRCWEVDRRIVTIHQMQGSVNMRAQSRCPECKGIVAWARKKGKPGIPTD